MKKILLCAVLLAASAVSGCGKQPDTGYMPPHVASEIQAEADAASEQEEEEEPEEFDAAAEAEKLRESFFDMNETAQAVPEEYSTVPADWISVTSMRGVTLDVPPTLHKKARLVEPTDDSFYMETYTDKSEEQKKATVTVIFMSENDWSVPGTEADLPDPVTQLQMREVYALLGVDYDEDDTVNCDEPLRALGIETGGTRYGRLKALLSLTEDDLSGIPAADAQRIRSMKGMYLMPFVNAFLTERENAHVLIHQYGGDSQYWVNVMPNDDLEYCVMVKAEDHDTAMRIAASARLEAAP